MKKKDVNLLELISLPNAELGEYWLENRRKKRPNKKTQFDKKGSNPDNKDGYTPPEATTSVTTSPLCALQQSV